MDTDAKEGLPSIRDFRAIRGSPPFRVSSVFNPWLKIFPDASP
jgi:hypothetical protein